MSHYALWLTDEQKNLILKYIQDRRYTYMIGMYSTFLLKIVMLLTSLPNLIMIFEGHKSWLDSLEILAYLVITIVISDSIFLCGIGKIFGKNSDYDCMKHDKYHLDFRDFGGKSLDTGKHPYYIEDNFYNSYICPIFLDYRNAKQGDALICVTLNNGKKYALLEKIDKESG